jgi:hypothetical protein
MLFMLILPGCVDFISALASSAPLSQVHVDAANSGATSALMMQAALNMVDATLIPLDTGLDPAAAPGAAAEAMRAVADNGCGIVTPIVDDTFTVDFGDGCTYGTVVVSGTVAVSVSYPEEDPNLEVGLVFTDLEVDGVGLEGEVELLSWGLQFDVALRLAHEATTISADVDVFYAGDDSSAYVPGAYALFGEGEVQDPNVTATIRPSVWITPGCWIGNGEVTVIDDSTGVWGHLQFSPGTQSSGTASFSDPPAEGCVELPSYTGCAATACGG